jgi:regulator of RNase E activity RraA
VHPGDIIMGDLNGTVVIPLERAEELLERLRRQAESEAEYTAAVARGDFSNAWVDRFLHQSGLDPEEAGVETVASN